ncbi:MAG: response regulator [Desulfobacter sp.]|nr:MAG: response regulator [Desulfobacter sp.]
MPTPERNKKQTILIVEDEKKIAALLSEYFTASGFLPVVLGRGDLVPALVREAPPDLIILDIMLPGMDGITLCKKLRTQWEIPIIMVTAKIEEADILLGLELGADDYICKPFSPREVVARAKTVLRRSGSAPEPEETSVGGIHLRHASREIRINEHTLPLTRNEYGILNLLMKAPGRVCSREELIKSVQGYESGEYKRTIDTHIKNLRKKLASALPRAKVILSVYGVGYKFNPNCRP